VTHKTELSKQYVRVFIALTNYISSYSL